MAEIINSVRGFNRRSIRSRATAGAAVGLVLLVLVTGLVIDQLVAREICRAADATLVEQATDRAQLIANGAVPATISPAIGEEAITVVLGPDGGILAASGTTTPEELVGLGQGIHDVEIAVVETESASGRADGADAEARRERIRLAVAVTDDGSTVIVGSEGEQSRSTIAAVRAILLVAGPLVAIIGALVAWLVVGRALSPVDQLRADLDGVIGLADGSRVTEPPTGDEIEALAATANDLLDRLERQSLARREFVADASHELKSPLANARALIETSGGSSKTAMPVGAVVTELDRLQAIVDDLLYLAQTDDAAPTTPAPFDIDDVLFDEAERAAVRTERTIDASGVQPARVPADRSEVARAVRDLIENAGRHATERVSVSVEPDTAGRSGDGGAMWVIAVDDDGAGIASADRARVFERFARIDADRSRSDGGTGLGLSIVASIAARNGGTISVADQPPPGTRLELRLPAAD